MKRFFLSLTSCSLFLILAAFILAPSSVAKEDLITGLLNLPAPPPPNPLVDLRALNRPESFYDRKNPPNDDAPIEDLLDYWGYQSRSYQELQYNVFPSEKSVDRLLAEIEKEPSRINEFLNVFPRSKRAVDFAKSIYDSGLEDEDEDNSGQLRRWLTYNSPYFSGSLERTARRVTDSAEYVTNQSELLALTRVDWQAARPIVDRLYAGGDKVSRVLAQWALYRNSLDADSTSDIDRYREELKAVVEDKTATDGMRDLAFDALSKEKEWPGRDEWYFSLFEDETLDDLTVNGSIYTGLTTLVIYSSPDKYVGKMIELVKSDNKNVRTAAAKNLLASLSANYRTPARNGTDPTVVKALLPWLSDPKWINGNPEMRVNVVRALQTVKIPESVPALIAALDEKATREETGYGPNMAANMMANAANTAANFAATTSNRLYPGSKIVSNSTGGRTETYYPLRSMAISALAIQGDMRAAPALRRILPHVESYERGTLIAAIYSCNGYTVLEQADALEAVAEKSQDVMSAIRAMAGSEDISLDDPKISQYVVQYYSSIAANAASNAVRSIPNPNEIKEQLGQHILSSKNISDALVRELVLRIDRLEKTEPEKAEMLRRMMVDFNGTAVNALLLRDLKNGKSNSAAVVKLLTVRKELQEKQQNDVLDLRSANPTAAGISACLLESEEDLEKILTGENVEAKSAMLACARLVRARLPIEGVAKYLSSQDKRLALAAERYLESEDSPRARSIVLSMHPAEAKIMGATTAFWPDGRLAMVPSIAELMTTVNPAVSLENAYYLSSPEVRHMEGEENLRNEVKKNPDLLGIYAYGNDSIHIFKDRAVYSWKEDESRYRERELTKEEFDDMKSYLQHHSADDLPPFLGGCRSYDCAPKQFLMLGKHGGRRIFSLTSHTPKFFAGLEKIFDGFRQTPGKIRYNLEKEVPGLEILLADENKSVETVWKNGSDFRLLVADKVQEKLIEREIEAKAEEMEAEQPEDNDEEYSPEQKIWELRQKRAYDNYGWFNFTGSGLGSAVPQPSGVEYLSTREGQPVKGDSGQWKARAAGFEIQANDEGLHRISSGKSTKILSGHYDAPVITPDGKWVVASIYQEGDLIGLVRVNLLTKRQFPVLAGDEMLTQAIAFVPSMNKVLVTSSYRDEGEEYLEGGPNSFFWLDAETGKISPAKGELRPISQQRFRPLQQTANLYQLWAAIPDRRTGSTTVGIYDSRNFRFKPVLNIPKIVFDSMDMWVDAGKVYFVYNGHLLTLPVPPMK